MTITITRTVRAITTVLAAATFAAGAYAADSKSAKEIPCPPRSSRSPLC